MGFNGKKDAVWLLLLMSIPAILAMVLAVLIPLYINNPLLFFVLIVILLASSVYVIMKRKNNK